ncbi:sensor histidine kinase [Niastella vici]|uniref:sensor histidine kinase n=1 Tax=Niastella vici TaxID=1703345 RepID=UPI00117EEC8B|nr:sensor histidine kinase [Niastella vici]
MKKRALSYHFLFWAGIYLLWVLIFRSYSFSITKTMTIEFCYLIFITLDFYVINIFIVPQFLLKKKYAFFVSATIIIIVASAGLRALVAETMNLHYFHVTPTGFSTLFLNSVINISLWVLLITMVKILIDRVQTQQRLEILEKEQVKSELDYLKAQINPHALLNSLNTIYGHIDKSNQAARNILLQFAELLRYQLYECGADKVDLEKEIRYLENYIAFQRLRKDEKLIVNFEAKNIEKGLKIAPLLLVVLVENAFKFVSNFSDRENKINITILTKGNMLHCFFINTKEMQQNAVTTNSNGIGITNLKRRLELLYAQKHKFSVNNEPDFYETNLIVDLS